MVDNLVNCQDLPVAFQFNITNHSFPHSAWHFEKVQFTVEWEGTGNVCVKTSGLVFVLFYALANTSSSVSRLFIPNGLHVSFYPEKPTNPSAETRIREMSGKRYFLETKRTYAEKGYFFVTLQQPK